MIRYLLAALVVLPVLVLVIGAATGRVKARPCCAPADPAKDLRMRGTLDGQQPHSSSSSGPGSPEPTRVQSEGRTMLASTSGDNPPPFAAN